MEPVGNAHIGSTDNSLNVNAVVLIEAFVLYCHKGVGKVFRDHVLGDRNTVGVLGNQFGCLVPLQVVDKGGEPGGCNLDVFNAGSRVDDTLKDAECHAEPQNARP